MSKLMNLSYTSSVFEPVNIMLSRAKTIGEERMLEKTNFFLLSNISLLDKQ